MLKKIVSWLGIRTSFQNFDNKNQKIYKLSFIEKFDIRTRLQNLENKPQSLYDKVYRKNWYSDKIFFKSLKLM